MIDEELIGKVEQDDPSLTSIKLIVKDDEDENNFITFCEALKENTCVTELSLDLRTTSLNSEVRSALAESLRVNQGLKELHLDASAVDGDLNPPFIIEGLVESLIVHKNLNCLKISTAHLTDGETDSLLSVLRNTNINVRLYMNAIDLLEDVITENLQRLLTENYPNLQQLTIYNDGADKQLLLSSLSQGLRANTSLMELELDGDWGSLEECNDLIDGLKANTSLKTVNMIGFEITGIQAWADFLQDSKSQILKKTEFYIGTDNEPSSLTCLKNLLEGKTFIPSLTLDIRGKDTERFQNGCSLLLEALKRNATISSFTMDTHPPLDEDETQQLEESLLAMLMNNSALTYFSLRIHRHFNNHLKTVTRFMDEFVKLHDDAPRSQDELAAKVSLIERRLESGELKQPNIVSITELISDIDSHKLLENWLGVTSRNPEDFVRDIICPLKLLILSRSDSSKNLDILERVTLHFINYYHNNAEIAGQNGQEPLTAEQLQHLSKQMILLYMFMPTLNQVMEQYFARMLANYYQLENVDKLDLSLENVLAKLELMCDTRLDDELLLQIKQRYFADETYAAPPAAKKVLSIEQSQLLNSAKEHTFFPPNPPKNQEAELPETAVKFQHQ